MKTGIELIAIERQEQIEKHGHQDCIWDNQELIQAAIATIEGDINKYPKWWRMHSPFVEKISKKPIKERLIIAGALIAAELDRLNDLYP